jgi:lysozyme family protein
VIDWPPDALASAVLALIAIYEEAGMKTNVDKLIAELIQREGRYVDHPADRGGPTNWGITQAVARAFGYTGDMRHLPRSTAEAIYRQRYWTGPRFDQVAAIYPRVAEEMLDTGVNMGPAVAGRFLQRVLNVLNNRAKDFPDLTVDGAIGPMTLAALRALKARRGAAGEGVLVAALDAQQGERYIAIAEANPSQEAFVYGWLAHRLGNAA